MKQRYVKRYGVKDKRFKGVQPKKYYIVDLKNHNKPKVISKYFDTKKQARYCITTYFKENFKRYIIIKWEELIEDPIQWATNYNPEGGRITKYDYPPECITPAERHKWRVRRRIKLGLKK